MDQGSAVVPDEGVALQLLDLLVRQRLVPVDARLQLRHLRKNGERV